MSETTTHSHAFQADVARLLHLMVHSVYSERDIFLRELISNAADACEKLRYRAIADPKLIEGSDKFAITVTLDKDADRLSVIDNGVGMGREDLISALGTIANSGTRAFLDQMKDGQAKEEAGARFIGQFGIGFYSAFMVADKVAVETRAAGSDEAWCWSSDGKGAYDIEPLALSDAPAHGTRVILHLNAASTAHGEPDKIEAIIREHSGAVPVPVDLIDKPGALSRRIADGAAVWAKSKSDIKPEDYTEFYRSLARQFDEPALTMHWRAEGRHEYQVLGFIPGSRPLDLFEPARKGHGKLYVRRVLITSDADLVPGWMRFVRLVVDSADLPLNVSREMIQESPVFAAIKKGVTNRVLQELTKLAESDAEKFKGIWENFGAVLKEGLYEDPGRRDALFKLARFTTSSAPDGGRTLEAYVKDLRPNQTAIYYLTGEDIKRLKVSPQLEGFRARGIEVLLLPDPVDAFWVTTAAGFEGKPFKSISQGQADIKPVPLADGAAAPEPGAPAAEIASLFAFMKEKLGDAVEDVRASERLSESAACLIAPEFGPDRRLERMLAQHGQAGLLSKPVLEVNPRHPLIISLATRFRTPGDRGLVEDAAWLIHDEARVMDGEQPRDAALFAARLARVLGKALS